MCDNLEASPSKCSVPDDGSLEFVLGRPSSRKLERRRPEERYADEQHERRCSCCCCSPTSCTSRSRWRRSRTRSCSRRSRCSASSTRASCARSSRLARAVGRARPLRPLRLWLGSACRPDSFNTFIITTPPIPECVSAASAVASADDAPAASSSAAAAVRASTVGPRAIHSRIASANGRLDVGCSSQPPRQPAPASSSAASTFAFAVKM